MRIIEKMSIREGRFYNLEESKIRITDQITKLTTELTALNTTLAIIMKERDRVEEELGDKKMNLEMCEYTLKSKKDKNVE